MSNSGDMEVIYCLYSRHFISANLTSLPRHCDVATGFNQMKPSHRTSCVAVHLTAAFDTVNYNVLLSKIARSTLPEPTCQWLSNYIRGRQLVTSCKGVESKARICHTGVPQGSKLLLLLSTHSHGPC